jgi:hypothetical protein
MTSRRILLALLLAALPLALAAGVYSLVQRIPDEPAARIGSPAPARTYFDAHGSRQALAGDRPALMLAYREGCKHCLAEFAALRRDLHLLAGADVVLLTADAQSPVGDAPADLVALKSAPGVLHGVVSPKEIYEQFGTVMTPALLIYRRGRLEARFIGETPIHVLTAALHRKAP